MSPLVPFKYPPFICHISLLTAINYFLQLALIAQLRQLRSNLKAIEAIMTQLAVYN